MTISRKAPKTASEKALVEVRRKIEEGLASLERGEGIPGERVFEELEARLATRERA